MGLASSITTALTGMQAAESQIDVIGNNLANSQTNGFKQSSIQFATQFLQTRSLGSSPTTNNGGTNPRQVGLGVKVNGITPEFTQGTIEGSANPSDLAIEGDGFFIVEGSQGQRLYTRNGQFRTNANNELVTADGNRVVGFGVDQNYTIQTTTLRPISIPLGAAAVAQATRNVTLEGVLSPSGDIADTAEVIQSATLGDSAVPRPDQTNIGAVVSATASTAGVTATTTEGAGGTHAEGAVYKYRFAFVDASGHEAPPSSEMTVTVPAGDSNPNETITLNNLPTAGSEYSQVRIYRTAAGGNNFFQLGTVATGGSFVDDNATPLSTTPLDTGTINGNYTYLVTWARTGEEESRPSLPIGPVNVVNGRPHLTNIPAPPVSDGTFPSYDKVRIYRNLSTDSNSYYLVDEINPGQDYTDNKSDAAISDLSITGNKTVDLDGPRIDSNTLLTRVVRRSDLDYENVFTEGTLDFTARKGGRELADKQFTITSTTTVQDLLSFMNEAMGIQTSLNDPQHPLPPSLNTIVGETTPLAPGATIVDGKIRFVSNTGVDNALEIGLSGFKITDASNNISTPNLGFGSVQKAKGNTAVADFIAYDSLGLPLNVRITTSLEGVSGTQTTYRWFADSPQNDPTSGSAIAVGTGLVTFDGEGKLIGTSNDTVSIKRRNVPSNDPLEFKLNFDNVSGLAADKSTLAASRQDGSAAGTLTSYIIGEDGTIRGVFSNGVSRDLGQLRLARFSNPTGLQQVGQTMFSQGVNSGLPIEGNPNDNGNGKIVAGARELSNTDIGKNLTDLVLASTTYRSNSRVITTAQQMLDELLNLRR